MTEVSAEAVRFKQEGQARQFDLFVNRTLMLLSDHPQGMTLASVQRVIGMSAKTAKAVLSVTAEQRDGRFFKCKPTTQRRKR